MADFDGDGIDDLGIETHWWIYPAPYHLQIYYGNPAGLTAPLNVNVSTPDVTLTLPIYAEIAFAGDVDGGGVADCCSTASTWRMAPRSGVARPTRIPRERCCTAARTGSLRRSSPWASKASRVGT